MTPALAVAIFLCVPAVRAHRPGDGLQQPPHASRGAGTFILAAFGFAAVMRMSGRRSHGSASR